MSKRAVMIAVFVMLIPSVLVSGLVLAQLWRWFLVPVFGLPELSIPAALGISLYLSFMVTRPIDNELSGAKTDDERLGLVVKTISLSFVRPLFVLVYGFILSLFMPK